MATGLDFLKDGASSASDIVIAAPYMKVGPLFDVLEYVTGKIRVVSRWSLQDIASSVSDLDCRSITIERNGYFFLHPRLHAKYYRFDQRVLIGSANLTSAALGQAENSNLEILCEPSSDFDYVGFEREMFSQAREVSDWEFSLWKQLVTAESFAPIKPIPTPALQLLYWYPHTRDPRHVWLAYEGYLNEIASRDEQRAALRDLEVLSVPLSLSYEEFRLWVAGCLVTSRFFVDAVEQSGQADSRASLYALAAAWEVAPRTAARRRVTALAWHAYFLG